MQTSGNHEEYLGQFQQAKEQFLTYVLSEQIPSSPLQKHRKKNVPKYHERQKLQLIEKHNNIFKDFNVKELTIFQRPHQNSSGRVIVIGSVVFKSNFQCGNIFNVKMVSSNTFEIELEKETNSNRQSAWFYFSVEGIRGQAHFIIQGFKKSASLYNEGMKICYRDVKEVGLKWRRGGTRISYSSTDQEQQGERPSYELRFSHFFKNNEHTCIEFAYCFPYGLKKLYHLIHQIKDSSYFDILGKTFNNQNIPLLTIGNKNSQKIIVLSARVHPGETVSSFIMEGFLKELVGDNQFGRSLRSNYLFKVIPMINPDGVIKGNYRFSGYGCDLNRKWKNCKQNYQPQVFYLKQLIKNLNKQKKVIMFIDMHGHSRKKNVFFYGCCQKASPVNTKPKEFPLLMQKIIDTFKYQNCCFSVQKDKEGTARITIWKQLKIDYVYTLQSSFCGSQFGPNYLEADFEKIGKKLCQGIAIFFCQDMQTNQKNNTVIKNIEKMISLKKSITQQLQKNPKLMYMGDEDDSGSESQPEVGQIPQRQRKTENGLPKPQALIIQNKKQQKSKKAKLSLKLFSQQSIRQNAIIKTKSEVLNLDDDLVNKINSIQLKNNKIQNTICIESSEPKYEKVQIKVANSINTFQLESLRASSLYQRNVRVHSITRNNHERNTERSRKVVNPFSAEPNTQEKEQKIRINLLHGRQGAQYRRVRKIAQQNLKKQIFVIQQPNIMVKQLQPSELQIGGSKNMPVAPRFYPMTQQKGRKGSLQAYFKKPVRLQQFKRLSINGDELNVRCIGKHVYI